MYARLFWTRSCPILAFLLLSATFLHAQSTSQSAVLRGRVTDGSGAIVAGAIVSIETESGRVLASSATDDTGEYRMSVPIRQEQFYRERVSAPSFSSTVIDRLALRAGFAATQDAKLAVGQASETVTVIATDRIGNGQVSTEAQLGMLGALSTFQTPFSVSSYTDQIVRDQQAQNVAEVLRNEPGLQDANGRYSEDSYLQFRGFALDTGSSLLNGIPYLIDYRSPSLENVERVELFKGPSALMNGSSGNPAPGGTINLTTKRAGSAPLLRFDGGYSSNSNFEGHLDAGRRFIHDGMLGLRAQIGGRNGHTPIDNEVDHIANASIEADVRTGKFRASLDASAQYRGLEGIRGPLYIAAGITVPQTPRLTSSIFDHSTAFTKHQYLVLAQAAYDPSAHIEFYGSYGHTMSPETYQGPYFATINSNAGDVTVYDIPYHGQQHANTGRVGGRLTFTTGTLSHQATFNGDFLRQPTGYFYEFLKGFQTNIYRPISLSAVTSHTVPFKNIRDTTLSKFNSFAAADLITAFHSRLVLIGGLRQQSIVQTSLGTNDRASATTLTFTPCTADCTYGKSALSPSGAALFRVVSHVSLYGNYIQDLQQGPTAPTGAINAGQIFPPSKAEQQEVGAKFEFAHSGATLAFFRIARPNGVLNPATAVYALTGRQRNNGMEAEFFGNVTPGIRLLGGITAIDARQQETADPKTEGKRAQGVPALQMTEGVEWTVPRARSLVLTGRVTASSGQYADLQESQRIPAWARLDIGGRYTLPLRYEPTLRVNLDNATGHNYWESGLQGLSYGAPRAIRVSTGFRF